MTARKYLKGEARIQVAAALKKRYEEGATIRQIAKETGYTAGRVAGLLWFAGTRMRPGAIRCDD
ncbi:helix-turn-helix domain-containing protein [Streptomyces mirabilis]|uniref:helix-turn-helix domain-containing protein n=1 Tax=Streptomyces mirabilis TaxID=68239 RepID=UPI003692CD35